MRSSLLAVLAPLALAALTPGCESQSGPMYPPDVENLTKVDTAAAFDEQVLKAGTPVLVDFYATWCGPCWEVAPTIMKLAPDYKGRAAFVVVDVDEATELARSHNIRSIPTLIVFAGGKQVRRMVGVHDEAVLRAALDAAVSP